MSETTVIIVNWNGREVLPECLRSLREQDYKHVSVTLVDNASTDGSVEYVASCYPEVSIVSLPVNLGFASANNRVLRDVQSKYVALLNNDTIAHPLWLKSLVNALERHQEAGFAASKILWDTDRRTIDRAGDSYTKSGAGLLRGRGRPASSLDQQEWVFGACGAAALYRREMLADIGLFDEDFFLIYEDIDLSFRAQLKGYRCLYVPEAIVYHKVSRSIVRDSPVSVYYGHRNIEWVYFKDMPTRLIRKSLVAHLLYDLLAFLFFVGQGRSREFCRAKKDAFMGLRRIWKKRRLVQQTRRVQDDYLWELFERECLFPRMQSRLVFRSASRRPSRSDRMWPRKG